MTLTHFSLVGFDGQSQLWKNWDNFPFLTSSRCSVSNSHYPGVFSGDLWHVSLNPHHFSEDGGRRPEVKVTSTFKLGDMAIIEYGKVRYVGRINFGFDQSVLALSILGVEGSELNKRIFTNSIKLYTNLLTTKDFLRDKPLLTVKKDKRDPQTLCPPRGQYY